MKNITAVTHITLSIGSAVSASTKYKHYGPVTIAKGDEGTSIVVERAFRNRRSIWYRAGYIRFGASQPVWVETKELSPALYVVTSTGRTCDEESCREIVYHVQDAANASANAHIAA